MSDINSIFRCPICGYIVHVIHAGAGTLVCCNQPMEELTEQTADYKTEKHVPIIEKQEGGYLVKVGSTQHPMEEKHYIEWIELIADGVSYRKYLKPGDQPEAFFCVKAEKVDAREYCNVHSLWKGEMV